MNALVKSSLKLIESIMKELNKALPTILIIVTMLVGVWNGCQSLEIKTEQKGVKTELAVSNAKQDEQLDNIELKVESANSFAAKDYYATEKLIEDMPPAKAADP